MKIANWDDEEVDVLKDINSTIEFVNMSDKKHRELEQNKKHREILQKRIDYTILRAKSYNVCFGI